MNDQPSRSSSCVESLKILFLHAQLLWPPPPFCCWWAHTNDSCLIGMQIPQTHKAKCEFVFWLRVTRHKHHERLKTKPSVGILTAGDVFLSLRLLFSLVFCPKIKDSPWTDDDTLKSFERRDTQHKQREWSVYECICGWSILTAYNWTVADEVMQNAKEHYNL